MECYLYILVKFVKINFLGVNFISSGGKKREGRLYKDTRVGYCEEGFFFRVRIFGFF